MKKPILFLFVTYFLTINNYSQITFEKSYFNNNSGYGASVIVDMHAYILGGAINYSTQYQPILIRTNILGDTIWTSTFIHGTNGSATTDAIKTNDNGYIFLNTYYNSTTKTDVYLTKTNYLGHPLWSKAIRRQNADKGYRLIQTSDNGYLLAGESNSLPGITGPYPYDAYIIKTNSNGDSCWTRNFGITNLNDYAHDLIETSDSNYVIVGCSQGTGPDKYQIFLIKLKRNGDTIWTRNIGDNSFDYGYCIMETLDKKYIIGGEKRPNPPNSTSDVYLVKTDTNGTVIWDKTYNFNKNDRGYRILVMDYGYLIAGISSTNKISSVLLIRTNDVGDTIWTKQIQLNKQIAQLKSISKCSDKGYVITGWFGNRLTLVKTDSLGCLKPLVTSINGEQNVSLDDTITYHNNSLRGSWYSWFSGSGNIVSSQGLNNINIFWNQIGIDTLYSVTYNTCGSDTLFYIINIDSCILPSISSIYGNFKPGIGISNTYYVDKIEGKTPINYTWTINLGTIISGQGTNKINVIWNNIGIDTMVVVAVNECGIDTSFRSLNTVISGIKEYPDSNKLVVSAFPVPTNEVLFLYLLNVFGRYEIEIFDINGKRIYFSSAPPGLNKIDVSNQSNGIYFVKISTRDKIIIKKIIINK